VPLISSSYQHKEGIVPPGVPASSAGGRCYTVVFGGLWPPVEMAGGRIMVVTHDKYAAASTAGTRRVKRSEGSGRRGIKQQASISTHFVLLAGS